MFFCDAATCFFANPAHSALTASSHQRGDLLRVEEEVREHGRVDHGTEFTSRALDEWAYRRGVALDFIRSGKPVENGYIESFNGKLRDECLNASQFLSIADARSKIEAWRVD
jgi:transposase InsO family protein